MRCQNLVMTGTHISHNYDISPLTERHGAAPFRDTNGSELQATHFWHTCSTLGEQAKVSLQCPDSLTMLMQIQWAPRMALGECRQIEQVSLSTPPQNTV